MQRHTTDLLDPVTIHLRNICQAVFHWKLRILSVEVTFNRTGVTAQGIYGYSRIKDIGMDIKFTVNAPGPDALVMHEQLINSKMFNTSNSYMNTGETSVAIQFFTMLDSKDMSNYQRVTLHELIEDQVISDDVKQKYLPAYFEGLIKYYTGKEEKNER